MTSVWLLPMPVESLEEEPDCPARWVAAREAEEEVDISEGIAVGVSLPTGKAVCWLRVPAVVEVGGRCSWDPVPGELVLGRAVEEVGRVGVDMDITADTADTADTTTGMVAGGPATARVKDLIDEVVTRGAAVSWVVGHRALSVQSKVGLLCWPVSWGGLWLVQGAVGWKASPESSSPTVKEQAPAAEGHASKHAAPNNMDLTEIMIRSHVRWTKLYSKRGEHGGSLMNGKERTLDRPVIVCWLGAWLCATLQRHSLKEFECEWTLTW